MKINIKIKKEDLEKSVIPVGETYEDITRLLNLKERIELVSFLMEDIIKVSRFRDRVEFSMKEAGKVAFKYLEELEEEIKFNK